MLIYAISCRRAYRRHTSESIAHVLFPLLFGFSSPRIAATAACCCSACCRYDEDVDHAPAIGAACRHSDSPVRICEITLVVFSLRLA